MTPTEHEARLAVRDFRSGLVVLAEALRVKADAKELLITLGAEGLLIHSPNPGSGNLMTDRLPAFNTAPKDVAGAGDCLPDLCVARACGRRRHLAKRLCRLGRGGLPGEPRRQSAAQGRRPADGTTTVRALLLSAGMGTRLRPLTLTTPKCLVPIHGVPLLDHWLALLLNGGIERTLINTHYLPEAVHQHIRQSPWKDRVDLVHEPELLGTGGTVLVNRDYFGSGAFLLAHSDNLTWFDTSAFIARHQARPPQALITMMTFNTDAPQSCGIVEQDADGIVIGFHEKVANPPGTLANGAVYIFEPAIIEFIERIGKPSSISAPKCCRIFSAAS